MLRAGKAAIAPQILRGAWPARRFHDESYGFRKPKEFTLPDYTTAQLLNRALNAPLLRYVDSIRTHGHRAARVDPLDIIQREEVAALDPTRYGLVDDSEKYNINGIIWNNPFGSHTDGLEAGERWWTLGEITSHLRAIYLGRIAYEYMHSPSKTERLWFSHYLESPPPAVPSEEVIRKKKRIHELLVRSETFDTFLQSKFPNLKRYGLEGGESMIVALDTLFSISSQAGIQNIVLAMPHRGRLNLLTDLLCYPPSALFHKIKGGAEIPDGLGAEGDVISHLATSTTLRYDDPPNTIKVSLLPNPSHLEAIVPVAMGKTRAKQYSLLKTSPADCKLGDKVMGVQLHGDAGFTGQGVIMEALGLSNLPHFTSGGSVHIVINNNIGYTTPATSARSSMYCSDVGKMINSPVLHVNGDYPEEVVRAVDAAFKYRHYFRKDVIIDLLVYRRWGHNELDEPSFTQPLMYQKIRSRKSVPEVCESKLVAESILDSEEAKMISVAHKSYLEDELRKASTHVPVVSRPSEQWRGMVWPASKEADWDPETGLDPVVLRRVGEASVAIPSDFELHSRLQRHINQRLQSLATGKEINWATSEAMAFGSLMLEGYDVRISGQDVGRGTFSQRHAMLVDQKTEDVFVPLNTYLEADGKLELANSSLSELGVLGFEYGASWERPNLLPIWEAQFGDFFNGAQVVIDTFIASAESKWLKQSGIVLLLPHGLDGAGPDHSSCRIERMLQLCDDSDAPDPSGMPTNINIHVTFPTTPAQYFHVLRRQMKRNFRKPLVIAGPKGLLRLPAAASRLSEFEQGRRFLPVLDDPLADASRTQRVVLMSGKIYYEIARERQKRGLENIALVRIEELAPFPFAQLRNVLARYSSAGVRDYMWLQEEPRNQGAWTHVNTRIAEIMRIVGCGQGVKYAGRKESALSAPGISGLYKEQQQAVFNAAFEGL